MKIFLIFTGFFLFCTATTTVTTTASAQAQKKMWEEPLEKEKSDKELSAKAIAKAGLEDVDRSGFVAESTNQKTLLKKARSARIQVITYRKPFDFDFEFTLLVVDKKIRRAFVVSTARAEFDPITGIHRLALPIEREKPFAWRRSRKYEMSPMYWGLQIHEGFFIHSSPHYGNLGRPASKGCVRTSIPDAMEMFDLLANQMTTAAAYSLIYDSTRLDKESDEGTQVLTETLRESEWSVDDLKKALAQSRREVTSVASGDLEFKPGVPVEAHVRPFSDQIQNGREPFPKCRDVDCWEYFSQWSVYQVKDALKDLKPWFVASNWPIGTYSSVQAWSLTAKKSLNLDEVVNKQIGLLDVAKIRSIELNLESTKGKLSVTVCDQNRVTCTRPRELVAPQSGKFSIPIEQIATKLSGTSAGLSIQTKTGEGSVVSATVEYYQ